jgi:hypothetical protein
MKKLLGFNADVNDKQIKKELEEAGIEICKIPLRKKPNSRISFTLIGKLGKEGGYAERLDDHWYVSFKVPMDVAIEIRKEEEKSGYLMGIYPFGVYGKNIPKLAIDNCISFYHIYSQEGLNFFAKILKKHRLI